jgi:hypothetical protein
LYVLAVVNFYRTGYSIYRDSYDNLSGKHFIYQHEDPRTTNIIRYLTGIGPLPDSERLPLYRQYVKNTLEKSNLEVPAGIYTLGKDDLDRLAITWYMKKFPTYPKDRETLQSLIDGLFEKAIKAPLKGFEPEVDRKIWDLLRAVGSPKIRWVEEQDEFASRFVAYSADDDKQSFYDPVDNTIYITYRDAVNSLLSETGHAKQFRVDNTHNSFFRLSYIIVSSLLRSKFNRKKAKMLYGNTYKEAGSFEYEAHKTNDPFLLHQFGLEIVNKTVPKKT